jgi:multidrug efflux pump subunit AcrB
LPVLAATLTTIVVFFPVTLLFGVSKFLFSALALAVVISLAASYVVALTVVPLFCARYLRLHHADVHSPKRPSFGERFNAAFSNGFGEMLAGYRAMVARALAVPRLTLTLFAAAFAVSLAIFPFLDLSFFPRTDAGQFVISIKAPSGTKLSETEKEIAHVEDIVRQVVSSEDLRMIVSNMGVDPDSPPSTPPTPPCIPHSYKWISLRAIAREATNTSIG